jgi:EAL domain-containing protein (putative c-di-GMP-specific phosphodiesterase class I)
MKDDEVESTLRALYAAIDERDGRWWGRHGELQLSSSFQPVFSFPHGRPVGYEALIRVADAQGVPVSPVSLFERVDGFEQQVWLDRLCRLVHVHNFCTQSSGDAWLFLNIHPAVFLHSVQQSKLLTHAVDLLNQLGIPMHRLVLEVTEDVMAQDHNFEEAVAWAREVGCLLALDDFGAGHSNFDRVWRLRPEIVKLDRSLLRRAMGSPRVARMLGQVVSLLHECGSLALLEGVESEDEAQLALDADVDLVQGYYFARPQPQLQGREQASSAVAEVWQHHDERVAQARAAEQARVLPYRDALQQAAAGLRGGQALGEAAQGFLQLAGSQLVYRLDARGCLVDEALPLSGKVPGDDRFAPLAQDGEARWSRRPYFRRALEHPGELQVTRPYLSLHGAQLCQTVSVALMLEGGLTVLCGDLATGEAQ